MPSTAVDGRPIRVLVVDDESAVCRFAGRVLTDAGYAVDTAPGGAEALSIVEREGAFDLFILDEMMPEMRGDELACQLRRRYPDSRVLYFTGFVDRLYDEKPLLWHNEAFVEKPVSIAGLREAVSLLLFGHVTTPAHLLAHAIA
jgi:CheY-like chemotaxis protein